MKMRLATVFLVLQCFAFLSQGQVHFNRDTLGTMPDSITGGQKPAIGEWWHLIEPKSKRKLKMVRDFEDGATWYIRFHQEGVVYMEKHATKVLCDKPEWFGRFTVVGNNITFREYEDTYFPFLGEYEVKTKTDDLFILKRK